MIISLFIWLVVALVNAIVAGLALLGTPSLPSGLTGALAAAAAYYTMIDMIIPMTTVWAIVAFDLAIEGAWWTYMLVRWGYQKIPGLN